MRDWFCPDDMFASYREITPDYLEREGIRALLIDIDNTLAPYEVADPDEEILAWFSSLRAAGVSVSLVSNNHAARVERFAAPLGVPAYPDSKKPGRRTLLRAMESMGVTADETAMLGDQILTDAFAGHRIGARSILVPPIRDKKNLFFRFKRWCERPVIRRYARQRGYRTWMSFWRIEPVKEKK